MKLSIRLLLAALFAVTSWTAATEAHADPATTAAAASVNVEVALVRASMGENNVDASLSPFARDLQGLPFQRFERVDGKSWSAKVGQAGQSTLAGGLKISATVESATADGCKVSIEIWRAGERVARTSFQRPWGRAHVVSVGREGAATLVVPVRVSR